MTESCHPPYKTPKISPFFAFQPLNCGYFYDECGEIIECPPLDAVVDLRDGGFIKKDWIRHVIYFLLNSDSQDDNCNPMGIRRGAASDGFIDGAKHGNDLWKNKKHTTSRDSITNFINILQADLKLKLKSLGLDLNLKINYKVIGAYNFELSINIDDLQFTLSKDTRNNYFNWAA